MKKNIFLLIVVLISVFTIGVKAQTTAEPTKLVTNLGSENHPPKIVSKPKNYNIKLGNAYNYPVIAEDEDNDELYYYLAIAPDFITITSDTGLLSSTGGLDIGGLYEIKVVVSDRKGGTDEQLFIIDISDKSFYDLEFVTPDSYSVLSEENKKLEWSILPLEGIVNLTLSYTVDGIDWIDFQEFSEVVTTYDWYTSAIPSGQYYLKLMLENTKGELFETISERFVIKSSGQTSDVVVIIVKSPDVNSEIKETKPEVRVEIIPSSGATINLENIKFSVDGVSDGSLADCTYTDIVYTCTLKNDLNDAVHKFKVEVADSNEKQAEVEWSVIINSKLQSSSFLGNILSQNSIRTGVAICLVGLLFLLIPWSVYYFVVKRKSASNLNDENVLQVEPIPQDISGAPTNITINSPGEFVPAEVVEQPQFTAEEPTSFAPEIGEQSIGAEGNFTNYNTEASVAATPSLGDSTSLEMPSSYADEEIPAWLKDFEADQPINPSGDSTDKEANELDAGSKVHDDYGIALNTDQGETSSTDTSSDSNR